MTGWTSRMRLVAACITLMGSVSLLEAAPVEGESELRPCTEVEICTAWGYGEMECDTFTTPGHNYCPTNLGMCGVNELGHIYWGITCTDYGFDPCPFIMPCG